MKRWCNYWKNKDKKLKVFIGWYHWHFGISRLRFFLDIRKLLLIKTLSPTGRVYWSRKLPFKLQWMIDKEWFELTSNVTDSGNQCWQCCRSVHEIHSRRWFNSTENMFFEWTMSYIVLHKKRSRINRIFILLLLMHLFMKLSIYFLINYSFAWLSTSMLI